MAGDWIKMEVCLPDKPEVWQIAGMLQIEADSVVGKLLRVWAWFDSHTEDGNAVGVSYSLIDRVSGVVGFAEAMAMCGWLIQNGSVLSLPKFSRHNGKTAKNRALTNDRVAKHRAAGNAEGNAASNANTVTKSVTREEKRREENSTPEKRGSVHGFPPGFEALWAEYPRKVGKDAAAKAFAKRKPDAQLLEAMVKAVKAQKSSPAWTKDAGQFIPHLSTWLNDGRWMDEQPGGASPVDDFFRRAL